VRSRRLARALYLVGAAFSFAASTGWGSADPTRLEETSTLVWVVIGISIAGAIVTWGFLIWAVWRYRDPATRGRRYG
jgi:hypothetical protein